MLRVFGLRAVQTLSAEISVLRLQMVLKLFSGPFFKNTSFPVTFPCIYLWLFLKVQASFSIFITYVKAFLRFLELRQNDFSPLNRVTVIDLVIEIPF